MSREAPPSPAGTDGDDEEILAAHPGVKLTTATRPVNGVNDLKAPPYSCRACEEGRHDRCAGTEYDISWSFPCTCRGLNQHFELVEVVEIPVSVFPEIIAEARAKALNEAADEFFAKLPDGTPNGRAYNSYTVAAMLRERAKGTNG